MPPATPRTGRPAAGRFEAWLPKTIVVAREGYSARLFLRDLVAGLTVGVIALPLAMAFAVNSGPGLTPERGLYTAIIAGFVASLLGGSRVSIAGPTGAFMPILFVIVEEHGYQGLALATLLAAVFLIFLGISRLGGLIKYIPYPVTAGFTSGIAVIIFSSQIRDLLGLAMATPPSDFIEKWRAYADSMLAGGMHPASAAVGLGGVALIVALRRALPRLPGAIVAVIVASVVVWALGLDDPARAGGPVATIGSRFGGVPSHLPAPDLSFLDGVTWDRIKALIPAAVTITLLGGIESLLCCVVADGMIGGRHRSNVELIGQGVANIASVLFGGITATGAIARTAANIKSGGRTPVAGMVHAAFVLLCMVALAPLASHIPMPVFGSVLVAVAWNMAEFDHFRTLLRAPRGDISVLLLTFALTVLLDLTIAVGFGMVLASLLFMKRMSEVTNVGTIKAEIEDQGDDRVIERDPDDLERVQTPSGVEVFEINGPFFFGVADRLKDTLRRIESPPRVFILRLRRVPAIDATALHALDEFAAKCRREGTALLLAGVHAQPMFAMTKYGLLDRLGEENLFEDIEHAIDHARRLIADQPAS